MKRIIFVVLLFSIILSGCSSKPETWTWITYEGMIFEFPQTWEQLSFSGGTGVLVNDSFGMLYFSMNENHAQWEETFYQGNESVFEVESDTGNHIIYVEISTEVFADLYDGQTEFVQYVAFVPGDLIATVNVPDTPELEQREVAIIDILQSVHVLQHEQNILSFFGGLAVMVYPDDWEITNWNSSEAPILENANLRVPIWGRTEIIDIPDREDVTAQEIIDGLLDVMMDDDVESFQRRRTTIYRDSNTFLFALDNGLVFSVGYYRKDGELQPEDEEIIMQMVDSILLNNRDSYDEPIRLRFP